MRALKLLTVVVAVAILTTALPSYAQILWYNGDFDGKNPLLNMKDGALPDGRVYDDFIVPAGQTWQITALFTNNVLDFATTNLDWEIREGMSSRNGGTVLLSGDGTGTMSATGNDFFGVPEFTFRIPVSLVLTPGTYWLMLRPVGSGHGFSYASSTSGANSIGTPAGNDSNAFFASTSIGANYILAELYGSGDFSMGIEGKVQGQGGDPAPEPTAAVSLGAAIVAALAVRRRRRSLAAA